MIMINDLINEKVMIMMMMMMIMRVIMMIAPLGGSVPRQTERHVTQWVRFQSALEQQESKVGKTPPTKI